MPGVDEMPHPRLEWVGMADLLLATKFYAPRPRNGIVPRPLLTERLGRGVRSKLTLISAPAGFGKSTLVTEWIAAASSAGQVTAWLSLDPGDNWTITATPTTLKVTAAAANGGFLRNPFQMTPTPAAIQSAETTTEKTVLFHQL